MKPTRPLSLVLGAMLILAARTSALAADPSVVPIDAGRPPFDRVTSLGGDGAWLSIPPPGPRSQHTAVFDPLRSRMLVFGGGGASSVFDVWAYDLAESVWTHIAVSGPHPPARSRHSAIYDAAHDRMIVFGGEDAGGSKLPDLWALDLSGAPAWSQWNPPGGPSARVDHGAIYDPVRQRMLVFGGYDTEVRNDVHALDLTGPPAWTGFAPLGVLPAARRGHSVFYDPPRDRMLVFGGALASGLTNDVWELSLSGGAAWALVPAGGSAPVPRSDHAAVYDALRDRMVMVGGLASTGERNDVRALSLAGAPAWSVLFPGGESFTPRAGHAALYDPAADQMVLFGGANGGSDVLELWFLPFATLGWSQRYAPVPAGRSNHAALYDATRRRMVILAGSGTAGAREPWALALDGEPRWEQLYPAGTVPAYRENYSAVLDPVRDRVLMFGGAQYSFGPSFNEVWALSLDGGTAWTLLHTEGTPPSPRQMHVAIYDPVGDRMIVFGGWDGSYKNDVWELDLDPVPTWTQLAPGGVFMLAWLERSAIYDPVRRRMIVFGGGDYPSTNEVVALDLDGPMAWERIDPPGIRPRPRRRHVAVYVPGADCMVIHGGDPTDGPPVLNDVWALTLGASSAWTELHPSGPAPTPGWNKAAIYDPLRNVMVVHGANTWGLYWNGVLDVSPDLPRERLALAQSRPNPASTRLGIDFRMAAGGAAEIVVHDLAGRALRTLANGFFSSGDHRADWDLTDDRGARVPAGVYFYRLRSAGRTLTRRAVVLP